VVKSPTLLCLKTRFLSRWNHGKLDLIPIPANKFFDALQHLNFFLNFDLRHPRGATKPTSCFCFCSLFRKGHHCGNKLFLVSVSAILTKKPIAGVEGTGTRPDYLVNRVSKKLRSHLGKKIAEKSRNSCQVNGRGCGSIGTVDSVSKCSKSYNEIQTLKECLFCHICCSQLCAHLRAIVTGSRTVSNRESLYPRSV